MPAKSGVVSGGSAGASNRRPRLAAQRVLVKQVNWLGDLVMTMPALGAVREAFPAAHLSVLVLRPLAGFFDGISWIDEVIPYPPATGLATVARDWQVIRTIRQKKFDLAILFPNSLGSALWLTLAGVPERVGYATDARTLLLTRAVTPGPAALESHQSSYWLELIHDCCGSGPQASSTPPLEPSAANLEKVRQWLAGQRKKPAAPLIALAPAAAYGPAKEWSAERFAALVALLNKRFDAECVILGTSAERPKCDQVAAKARTPTLMAAGVFDLGELIALLTQCQGFAGNDSGAMHLAAALGIAAVGIFGSTNPIRTGPRGPRAKALYRPPACSPCLARTCRFGHYECLGAINPDDVANALEHLGAFQSV